MKKLFIITLILLIQSFPSFGSVDGKGIVCKCLDCKLEHIDPSSYMPNNIPTEIGFHFKINKVKLITNKKREGLLPEISKSFISLYSRSELWKRKI